MINSLPRSVRGRLVLLVAAVAVPALLLAVLIIVQSYRNERAYASSQLTNTARAFAGVVDGEIDQADEVLKLASVTMESSGGRIEGLEDLMRGVLRNDHRWFLLSDASGQEIFNTRLPAGTKLPSWQFDETVDEAARTKTRTVSNLATSADGKTMVLHVQRTWPTNGPMKYVLTVGFRPAALARAVRVDQYEPGGIAVVVDRKGKIVARSLSPETFVGQSVRPEFYEMMSARPEGVLESLSLEKIPVLSSFSRTQAGWTVAIAVPQDRLYATSRRLLYWAVGTSAFLTLCAIFLAKWISQSLLRSVDLLIEKAAALGRGEMPVQRSSGLTEADFVAEAMDRTAELLRQRTRDNEALHAELERKVEDRTASLREAVAQMEEFSYTVSHDLRSPLRAMQGYAQLLLEEHRDKLDEMGAAYLDRIGRAAERMDRLTSDLLSYTRLSRAQIELAPTDVDALVRDLVEHYIELHRSGAVVEIKSPLDAVMAHQPSLVQAISNLLTNAVKFVKPGQQPQVTIRTESHGTRIRIWVEDQGISIPPENQAGLFRMFERLPTTGKYEGTGVGLAIVRKAAEKMGGSCGVESDGHSGSRFWIELAATSSPNDLCK